MHNRNKMESRIAQQAMEKHNDAAQKKLVYNKPRLTHYGDVRDLTMSPSPGMFESGPGSGYRS